jgi:hypothetical protein
VYSFNISGPHVHATDAVFCSPVCRDAGKPIHPGEGEQRRCGAVGYPKKDTP